MILPISRIFFFYPFPKMRVVLHQMMFDFVEIFFCCYYNYDYCNLMSNFVLKKLKKNILSHFFVINPPNSNGRIGRR